MKLRKNFPFTYYFSKLFFLIFFFFPFPGIFSNLCLSFQFPYFRLYGTNLKERDKEGKKNKKVVPYTWQ